VSLSEPGSGSNPHRALVVLPTFNEAENISTILERLRRASSAFVLVVDDASPDGTADLAAETGRRVGAVDVLNRAGKEGLGSAYRAGFAWGLEQGFDVMIEMDADGSHDPSDISRLLSAVDAGADLAIGSRYVPGGSTPDWTTRRIALSRWGNRYVRAVLGLPVADATAGFRAYRASLLDKLDLATVRAEGYAFQIEMTRLSARAGATITEVPICFLDRRVGQSKMSGRIVAEALALVALWGIEDRVLPRARRTRRRALV
jgi:dolichol-phosphate mannosyltransferase